MAMACRRDLPRFCYTLLLLSAAVHLQASPILDGSGSSATEPSCATIVCAEGYKCMELPEGDKCVNAECDVDCSNEPHSPLCASNGHTYDNECEFVYQRCIEEEDWSIIYPGKCVTLPPPKEQPCNVHQATVNFSRCDTIALKDKLYNGTLQLSDLTPCYYPRCESVEKGGGYSKIQCSSYLHDVCWCSNEDGLAINGTLVPHRNPVCDNRSSCAYNGEMYPDGSVFHAAGQCGICSCLNGTVSCIADYIPADDKHLTDTQTQQLKDELIQFYDVQYRSNSHDHLIDVRLIQQYPKTISTSQKKAVLEWIFAYYDGDGNDELSKTELVYGRGRRDMHNFFGCTKFLEPFYEMVDENANDAVVLSEWLGFFDIELQTDNSGSTSYPVPFKRSAPNQPRQSWRRKRRSRFLYSLN